MKRRTRQQTNAIGDYNNNKKRKLENEKKIIDINQLVISFRSRFEDLANEILYEIFEHLDINDAYEGFFNLNKRFQNLFLNSNLPIQINISTISKSNFERYYKNLILPNKHRINVLRLSNPFTVDIIFSPPRILSKFVQLETLILDNIKTKYFNNILNQLYFLPKLHSLVLILTDYLQCPTTLFFYILRLRKLKYCNIEYQTKNNNYAALPISFDQCEPSPIEHLVINTHFQIDSFKNLLVLLPKLRYLSIDYLVEYRDIKLELCPLELKDLKYVFLNLNPVRFDYFEDLVKNFFRYIEVLHVTMQHDPKVLDAKRWEQLISSFIPNLRIFDINYFGYTEQFLTHCNSINQFKSSFWTEKQWFFTYQHARFNPNNGIFYSAHPYRKKDYIFREEFIKQLYPKLKETNLNSVKHVFIRNGRALNNSMYYFPNATELTIKDYFEPSDDPFIPILHRIVRLEQLTKLVFDFWQFPFEKLIELLRLTSNLHTLKLNILSLDETNSNLLKQNETFQYVSTRNKIKNLELCNWCALEQLELFVDLFPQLKSLKIGMNKKEIEQIIRFLFSNINHKICHLFLLCISSTPKRYLSELNMLIKSENLLNDYFIKFINRDLYLYW